MLLYCSVATILTEFSNEHFLKTHQMFWKISPSFNKPAQSFLPAKLILKKPDEPHLPSPTPDNTEQGFCVY